MVHSSMDSTRYRPLPVLRAFWAEVLVIEEHARWLEPVIVEATNV